MEGALGLIVATALGDLALPVDEVLGFEPVDVAGPAAGVTRLDPEDPRSWHGPDSRR